MLIWVLGCFEVGILFKSFDEMYVCVINEFEWLVIDDMLFGLVIDVLDCYFLDCEKYGVLCGLMIVLVVNMFYCGLVILGSVVVFVFGLGVLEGDFVWWKKLCGGIGVFIIYLL